jgi:DNA-binding XRE family transcriptional regulator
MSTRGNTIRIPRGMMTTAKLAQTVGVSADTIRRWKRDGLLPFTVQDSGQLTVALYGPDAVRVARSIKRYGHPPGGASRKAA